MPDPIDPTAELEPLTDQSLMILMDLWTTPERQRNRLRLERLTLRPQYKPAADVRALIQRGLATQRMSQGGQGYSVLLTDEGERVARAILTQFREAV